MMIEWLDHPVAKIIGLIASILGIYGFLKIGQTIVKNKVSNTKIGGSFTGRKGKSRQNLTVENTVKNSEIKGDYIGSDES